MGIQNALSTAVTGLSAQSYALENISGNISNSQTVGFKRVDTSFVDLIPDSAARHEFAGSVSAFSNLTNTLQGTLKSTGIATNLAINGDGFFVVTQNTGTALNPTFAGQNNYTRRGDFSTNASGYLVNGSGNYLVGMATGASAPGPIQIPTTPLAAKMTTTINYQGNLPSYPKTTNASTTTAGSELMTGALATPATIAATDNTTFQAQSLSGGEVTVYDTAGTPVTVKLRWGKTASASGGGTDTWNLYYESNANATGAAAQWTKAGTFTFTASGTLTSASTVTLTPLAVNGSSLASVQMNFGGGKLTQYADQNGTVGNTAITQNGYTTGTLGSISVTQDGQVMGSYSNGQVTSLAQVQIAKFKSPDSLKRLDGGTYAQTANSGPPTLGLNGSSLTAGSVEMSNTDISDEFSKMIVTQQAYSANTRVMSTAQQMLQDIINIIR